MSFCVTCVLEIFLFFFVFKISIFSYVVCFFFCDLLKSFANTCWMLLWLRFFACDAVGDPQLFRVEH